MSVRRVPGLSNEQALYPLSANQRSLWLLYRMQPALRGRYYARFAARVSPSIEPKRLQAALDLLMRRHAMLRTRIFEIDGSVVQRAEAFIEVPLTVVDVADINDPGLVDQVEQDSLMPFDEAAAPLLRAIIYRAGARECVLSLVIDHLVCDAWSMWQLVDELAALLGNRHPVNQAESPEFREFVAAQRDWLEGAQAKRQLEYWRSVLTQPSAPLELPYDRRESESRNTVATLLDAPLTAELQNLARQHGVSLFIVLLAANFILLHQLTGQSRIAVGSPMPARTSKWARTIGTFSNTVVLQAELEPECDVAALLQQLRGTAWRAMKNQAYPFAELVERLAPQRGRLGQPYFQTLFVFQNARAADETLRLMTRSDGPDELRWGDFELRPFGRWQSGGGIGMDLLFETAQVGDRLYTALEYHAGKFERATIERYLSYWQQLLRSMVADARQKIGALSILSQQERARVMGWSAARANSTEQQCVHELFEAQVERNPHAIAIELNGEAVTYAVLNQRANALAHFLRSLEVGPEVRVALCVERSVAMVVAVLAVLKAGGAYVPLDPAYPRERLQFMLQDCQPRVLLVDAACHGLLPQIAATLSVINVEDEQRWASQPTCNVDVESNGLRPTSLAYVIYTSGSTGMPKGVMIEHANVTRLITSTDPWFGFDRSDRWLLFHSYAFDFSVWELWGALAHGGQLFIVTLDVARSPQRLYQLICDAGITVLNQTPSAFRQLIQAQVQNPRPHHLRYVIFGGESLDTTALQPWYEQQNNRATQLVNMYGITETTVHVTYKALMPADAGANNASVGRPIPDLEFYILDAHARLAPIGVVGEIYVGGAGVARGYLNRGELTSQRFVSNPFSERADARLYRSGDLARWLPDGEIEYLGRNDAQLKVRGFRIEPGEIEARLREHPDLRDAIVLPRTDAAGEKCLVAYYVGDKPVSPAALHDHAVAVLPHYMVPAAYVWFEKLPLTTNGKLDQRALPLPTTRGYETSDDAVPRGDIEQALAKVWATVLQVSPVGRNDHFFKLGGHSFLAIGMVNGMRELGYALDVQSVFDRPTLSALAQCVQQINPSIRARSIAEIPANSIPADCAHISARMLPLIELSQAEIDTIVSTVDGGIHNVQDIYPLTSVQEGILFHHVLEQQGDAYLLPTLLSFDSRHGLDDFIDGLRACVARHDILRTAFLWRDLCQPAQVVWRQAELQVTQIELDAGAGSVADQLRGRFAPLRYRLDVTRAPLLRACIAHDEAERRWLLMVVTHHLIQDNITLQALLEEMRLRSQGLALPVAVPYRNYVAYLQSAKDVAVHEAFFREMLGAIDEPTLPFGLAALGDLDSQPQRCRIELAASLAAALRKQARTLGISAASLFHLAWARLVGSAAGREHVVFGTILFGRSQAGFEASRASGVFTNTLPICISVDGAATRTRLIDLHHQLARLLEHESASLVLAQRCSSVPAATPLFSALLNYRHGFVTGGGDFGWPGAAVLDSEEGSHYPLRLSIDDTDVGFGLTAHAPAQVGAQRIVGFVTTILESMVAALEHAPETPVNQLEMLPVAERSRLLNDWNQPSCRPSQMQCVHELFESQVANTPDAIAVEDGERKLTYSELNCRANRLARYLQSVGVVPEQRVALCMERSIEMIVGVLAILKAGGVYVPLEPSYPAARLEYMLEDAAPCLLLTQHSLRGVVAAGGIPTFEVDSDWDVAAALAATNLPCGSVLAASSLASITYTSGSTGRPKGVMADHARTANRLVAQASVAPVLLGEACAQKTAIGFVDSIFEILHPLVAGGKLVVIPNALASDLRKLSGTVAAQRVERWITVPSLAAALLLDERCVLQLQGLRHWLLSGEALSAVLLQQLRRKLPRCSFINIYGASEAADATYYVAGARSDERVVPIGRPLAHTQVYILDAQRSLVPMGVVGEIYVGGASLARGYWNLPELTEQRFVLDPFARQPGARMYRTGDLGRWCSDGMVEYLGRNDYQVKIRGFRIELAEVEAILREHPQVEDVVVMAREAASHEQYLVAYYVSDQDISVRSLRNHAAAALPNYMIPTAYVRVAVMPLTPNGKLDRRALPAPDGDAHLRDSYDAPQGEIEGRLAQLWVKLLRVERVGRRDNFFELGGHSLLAVSLIQLIKVQMQADLSIAEVFEHPELAQLAERLTEAMLEQFDADELIQLADS